MKKLLVMATALLLSISMVTACGKDDPKEASKSSSTYTVESSSKAHTSRNFLTSSISKNSVTSTEAPNSTSSSTPTISGNVTIPTTTIPEGTSPNAKLVMMQINLIEEITAENYKSKHNIIVKAEEYYNKLTASEQAEVINYQDLLTAKEACNKMISSVKIMEFKKDYETLLNASTLDKSHVELVASLRTTFATFNQEELAKLDDATAVKAKLDECYNALKSQGLMEFAISIESLADLSQSTFFTFSSGITVEDMSQDKLSYNGGYPSKAVKLENGASITFTTPISGTLTVYAYRTDKLTLTGDKSGALTENIDSSLGDDFSLRTFTITQADAYTLSLLEGEVFVFALVLSA